MTAVRDARADAIRSRWRALQDSFETELPRLPDRLEAIDRQYAPEPGTAATAGKD